MSKPQDFFGSSPKTVLNKPFFHAQDQKAYNVDGGTSIADAWTKRTLNTVIHNDIQGASLGTNEVNLPAGTYYVEGSFIGYGPGSSVLAAIFKDGNRVLLGLPGYSSASYNSLYEINVIGIITLENPGAIDLRYYAGVSQVTSGLGVSNSNGSITDASIPSIYADLKIWQLDRSLEIAPKAVNSGLQTIAGMNTEGGTMGGDVTVSGNTLTISKCSCMSSDLTTAMATTSDSTVTLDATVNQDFYIFMVRLVADGTFTMKAYTTYAGPTSDVLVDKFRFVSYAKNNGAGVTMPFRQIGDRIDWLVGTNRPVLTASITASYAPYNLSASIPVSNVTSLIIAGTTLGNAVYSSYDGATDIITGYYPGEANIIAVPSIYLKSSPSMAMHIQSITLRR
jgi:hypothetical protein